MRIRQDTPQLAAGRVHWPIFFLMSCFQTGCYGAVSQLVVKKYLNDSRKVFDKQYQYVINILINNYRVLNRAYRYGKRHQRVFLPQCIDDYVSTDAPARAYDAFVEALDFNALGIHLNPHKVGNSGYDPKAMLKLVVYGYSYGLISSRKLERDTHYNLSFMWLMGGLKPDHKAISEFRRKHKKEFKKVIKLCASLYQTGSDRWQCIIYRWDQEPRKCCSRQDP
jgi:transposase